MARREASAALYSSFVGLIMATESASHFYAQRMSIRLQSFLSRDYSINAKRPAPLTVTVLSRWSVQAEALLRLHPRKGESVSAESPDPRN